MIKGIDQNDTQSTEQVPVARTHSIDVSQQLCPSPEVILSTAVYPPPSPTPVDLLLAYNWTQGEARCRQPGNGMVT